MAADTKKKKRKEEAYAWKAGTSSGHITNLKQSILDFRYLCGITRCKLTIISESAVCKKFLGQIWSYPARFLIVIH
jgi:hypothetical protein